MAAPSPAHDVEAFELPPLPSLPPGYPALAGKMSQYLQFGIMRGFWSLATRNLLYYQAELTSLEHELLRLEVRDQKHQEDERGEFAGNWKKLSGAGRPNDEQWKKFLEIRDKLKEYYEVVIQISTVASMQKPPLYDLEYIKRYIQTKEMGPEGLFGEDCHTYGWGSDHRPAPDLFTIRPGPNEDPFSNWFIYKGIVVFLSSCFRRKRKSCEATGEVVYKDKKLLRITNFITCIVAAILPSVAIAVLSYVSNFRLRLTLVALFSVLLAVCLTAFTKATRAESFTVLAAFGAIAVVFVGQNQSCNCKAGGN